MVLETLPSDVGHVGWNRISKRVQRQIYGGYRYRIRAEAGSSGNATTWYLGQYVQQFSTSTPPGPQLASQAHIYLPLILHKLAVPTSRVGENLLRNSTFEELEPDTLNQPRYWVEGPINLSFLASFTAPDSTSVFVVQNVELRPLLNDIGPVHVAGSE